MIAQLCFYFFMFLAVAAGIGMLIFKNPMRVALCLITIMLSLASIFALIENHVLAVFQILIYVGAIMVFIVYVIMLLDPHDQALTKRFSKYAIGGGIMLFLSLSFLAPKAKLLSQIQDGKSLILSFKDFANIFLKDYFIFFELTSVLLIVGVVGAVAIIKGRKNAIN